MESLASYVSAIQQRRVAARRGPPTGPSHDRFLGSALFVDIAGFSSLAERLAQAGAEGAERLSEILNAYFGQLTDLVVAHGGDVQLFAGDAALALWHADDAPTLEAATIAATQCALAIRDRLHDFAPAPDVTLGLRAGIGAGALGIVELGGVDDQWTAMLVGDPIRQAGDASGVAEPGHVVLSADASRFLPADAHGAALPGGWRRVDVVPGGAPPRALRLPPVSPDLLRPYVPPVVRDRVDAGHGAWGAEFRRVSVVFINLLGLPDDPAAAPAMLHRAVETTQREMQRRAGAVYQALMDDKGLSIIGAFGLPPGGAENAAARAVESAVVLSQELAALGLTPTIGVATGRTFCGAYGSVARRQYTIVGTTINLAARLMKAAAHGVLVDDATRQVSGGHFAFDTLDPIRVKGFAQPVSVHRPRGRASVPLRAGGQFIAGRATERAALAARVDALGRGDGGLVWIEGEAGIGKSYLLADLADRARGAAVQVVAGAGDAVERTTAYFAWRDLLARLAGRGTSLKGADLREALLAPLADQPELAARAPVLNAILPLQLPETPFTEAMRHEVRADAIKDLTVALVASAAREAPLVLVLDDVHWLDSASLDLAAAVAARVPRLLVVLSSRPLEEPTATGVRRLMDTANGVHLPLGPLGEAELPALLAHCLRVSDVPQELVAFILGRAEGHPFYSEELARALSEAGLVTVDDGVCRLAAGEAGLRGAEFPDTVHGVVSARIDRLPLDEQLMLKSASIIGRVFEHDVLHDVYPVPTDLPRLRRGLEHLEDVDLTRVESPDPHLAYLFRHAIVQDVAYGALLFAQRRQLHRAVAEWYERHRAHELAPLAPLLAHHWDRAGEPARAIPYLERAAEQAVQSFANREARSFLERAKELAAANAVPLDAQRRAQWEFWLGEAAIHLSEYNVAGTHLRTALALLGYPLSSGTVGMTAGIWRELAAQILHRLRPARFVGAAPPGERAALATAALATKRFAEAGWFNNEQVSPVYATLRCTNLAERGADGAGMIDGYATLAILAGMARLTSAAHWYVARAQSLARDEPNVRDLARIQLNYASNVGDWELVERTTDWGCELFGRQGARFLWEACRAGRGFTNLSTGRFVDARRCFDETFASARYGALQSRLWARAGQCATLLATRGRVDPGLVADYRAQLKYNAHRTEETVGHGLLAVAALRDDDRELALTHAATALAQFRATPPNLYYSLWSVAGMCEVFLADWRARAGGPAAAEARRRARQSCMVLRQFAWMLPVAGPRAALHRGQYAWQAGHARRARRLWDTGLQLAERLRMPYDYALLELESALHLSAQPADRRQQLHGAAARLAALGAEHDAARAAAAIQSVPSSGPV